MINDSVPASETEAIIWFHNDGRPHDFASHDVQKPSFRFQIHDLDLHSNDQGTHLLGTVHNGSKIDLIENRNVRIAGTGKRFMNFSKYSPVERTVERLIVDELSAPGLQEALKANRPVVEKKIELYNLSGERKIITVASDITKADLEAQVKGNGFTRYSEVV
jgi:hypothetical protein